MSSQPIVPMFDPTGTLRDVPQAQMMDARQNGMEIGVRMQAPDNTVRVVPASKYQEAAQNGMKPLPIEQQAVQHPGFWSSLWSDIKGMPGSIAGATVTSPYPGMDLERKQQVAQQALAEDASRKQAGYGPVYRTVAPIAEAVGTNVPGMEQSAREGDPGGVLGHAAAGATVASAPLTLEGLLRGGAAVADRIPSFERAGAAFKDVSAAAGKVPVDLNEPAATAFRLMELRDSGNYMPRSVAKFLQEATDPSKPAMTYDRVRDFASTASRLSVDEYNRMTPNVQRLVGQFARQLNDAAGDAAGSVGKQQAFEAAMQEWRSAAKLAGMKQGARSLGAKMATGAAMGAAGAAGAGLVAYPFRHTLYDLLSGGK